MNKAQINGHVEVAKAKFMEATCVMLDENNMEVKGNIQKNVGKIQVDFGDQKEDI